MQRILVIGNAGAGKTTFSRKLAEKTGLPLVHLDQLYWQGDWQPYPREVFLAKLQQELEKPNWILDGNFNRTIPHRLQYCDTVIFLDFPTPVCLLGITQRTLTYLGKTRPDMGGNCPENFGKSKWELYKNVLTFNKKNRAHYFSLLSDANIRTLVFRSRKEAAEFLNDL